MLKTVLTIFLILFTTSTISFEDDLTDKIEGSTNLPKIQAVNMANTLGSLIKKNYLGRSVLVEKPDRGSDVSLVEITISINSQKTSPYICSAGDDYLVICRKLKGGILTDIYSTSSIIIHDNKFCDLPQQCSESEALSD